MAIKIKKAKTKVIRNVRTIELGNNVSATNLGCMASDGNNVWALKTFKYADANGNKDDTKDQYALFHSHDIYTEEFGEFLITKEGILGGGNGMSCNSEFLAFGCANRDYILRVKRPAEQNWDGKQKFNITNGVKIGPLSAYKPYQYVARNRKVSFRKGTDHFVICKMDAEQEIVTQLDAFKTHIDFSSVGYEGGVDLCQDIFYDKQTNLLYVPYSKYKIYNDNNGKEIKHLVINIIAVFDLAGGYSGSGESRIYEAVEAIIIDKSDDPVYETYEVESMGLDADRKMLIACNIEGTGVSDSIDQITNLTF